MKFRVLPPSRGDPKKGESGFALMQDKWNDYGFQTQYHLYWTSPDAVSRVGAVKILKRGQTAADPLQLTRDFDGLSDEYVSVGESLDYYQHLSELGPSRRDLVFGALRDCARYPEYQNSFESEEGWRKSLFRDLPDGSIR